MGCFIGGMFTGSSAIRLIRFGHHLLGDAPGLLVFGVVVTVSSGLHRPYLDILLGCQHLVLILASFYLVLQPDSLPRLGTLPVFVLFLPVGMGILDSVLQRIACWGVALRSSREMELD